MQLQSMANQRKRRGIKQAILKTLSHFCHKFTLMTHSQGKNNIILTPILIKIHMAAVFCRSSAARLTDWCLVTNLTKHNRYTCDSVTDERPPIIKSVTY